MIIHRRLFATSLLPIFLITIGMTLGNAFVPLYARKLGASMAGAALVASLMFIGQAAADLPGGWLVHRFGEKFILSFGGILMVLAMALRLDAQNLAIFTFSVILFGIGTSMFWIAQMSWLKKEIGGGNRGHAMSLVGGSLRIANFVGPLAGGFIAEFAGYRLLFAVQGLFCLAASGFTGTLLMLFFMKETRKN